MKKLKENETFENENNIEVVDLAGAHHDDDEEGTI